MHDESETGDTVPAHVSEDPVDAHMKQLLSVISLTEAKAEMDDFDGKDTAQNRRLANIVGTQLALFSNAQKKA